MLSTTEDTILNAFTKACGHEGSIERVKKLKDYAFVHFRDRDDALQAMSNMNGNDLDVIFSSSVQSAGRAIVVTRCRHLRTDDFG